MDEFGWPEDRKLKMCKEVLPIMCESDDFSLFKRGGEFVSITEHKKDLISLMVEYCLEYYESANMHDIRAEFKKKYERWI